MEDPVKEFRGLFLLFLTEARDHLEAAEDALLALERHPEDRDAIQVCFRSLHSLKGCSSFFRLTNVERLAHTCEQVLARIRNGEMPAEPVVIGKILAGTAHLSALIAGLARLELQDEDSVARVSRVGQVDLDLIANLEGAAGEEAAVSDVAPSDPGPIDTPATADRRDLPMPGDDAGEHSLEDDFKAEASELLDRTESLLIARSALDPEDVRDCFRSLHTLKGIAAYLGRHAVERRAHAAEELFVDPASHEVLRSVSAQSRERLLDLLDEIRHLVHPAAPRRGARPAPPTNDAPAQARAPLAEAPVPAARHPASEEPEQNGAGAQTLDAPAALADTFSRVATAKLEDLVNLVGELVISHAMLQRSAVAAGIAEISTAVNRQGRILRQLQGLALGMRMVPLRTTFRRLARAVHDAAQRLGKEVDLATEGEDTEIDRTVAENLADPLLHMVRNAVDHGIESPEERAHAGKPRRGTIRLTACQAGEQVIIRVSDDGRGVDIDAVRRRAQDRGLIHEGSHLGDDELLQILFRPGFTTRDEVTDLSGRGVGLDVVKGKVQQLKGDVDLANDPGHGTTFTVRVPLTTAILDAMLLRVGEERFLVPMTSVVEAVRADPAQLRTIFERGRVVESRGQTLPVTSLGAVFGSGAETAGDDRSVLLVLERFGGRIALVVDQLLGQQQVVIKPLPAMYRHHPGLAGSAILADGHVGLIIDPNRLLSQEVAA